MDNRVKVGIFGQTYTINADVPADYILKVAEYVDGKMREMSRQNPGYSQSQVAILVALNIADEFLQLQSLKTGHDGVLEKKTMALISMLDQGLIGDTFTGVEM